MTQANMTANIVFDGNKATQAIGEALALHINDAARRSIPAIQVRAREAFEHSLKREPTYNQLVYSNLRGELGLSNPDERAQAIIDILKSQVHIELHEFKWYPVGLRGEIQFHVAQRSYEEILASPAAQYISYSGYGGHLIPWLRWLIKEGTEILVKGWQITYSLNSGQKARSRSGLALMIHGSEWGMPSRYAGDDDFNWITKSLETLGAPVQDIIVEELVANV